MHHSHSNSHPAGPGDQSRPDAAGYTELSLTAHLSSLSAAQATDVDTVTAQHGPAIPRGREQLRVFFEHIAEHGWSGIPAQRDLYQAIVTAHRQPAAKAELIESLLSALPVERLLPARICEVHPRHITDLVDLLTWHCLKGDAFSATVNRLVHLMSNIADLIGDAAYDELGFDARVARFAVRDLEEAQQSALKVLSRDRSGVISVFDCKSGWEHAHFLALGRYSSGAVRQLGEQLVPYCRIPSGGWFARHLEDGRLGPELVADYVGLHTAAEILEYAAVRLQKGPLLECSISALQICALRLLPRISAETIELLERRDIVGAWHLLALLSEDSISSLRGDYLDIEAAVALAEMPVADRNQIATLAVEALVGREYPGCEASLVRVVGVFANSATIVHDLRRYLAEIGPDSDLRRLGNQALGRIRRRLETNPPAT